MKKILNRKKLRLEEFDYSSEGAYFITICTKNRENFFGEIAERAIDNRPYNSLKLTEIGEIAQECWYEIPQYYPNVRLGEFCVMPNHIHGIIWIENQDVVGAIINRPYNNQKYGLISKIIKSYKSAVTKKSREFFRKIDFGETHLTNMEKFQWQRSFHDRVIRNEEELQNFTEYIKTNPENWEKDDEFIKL